MRATKLTDNGNFPFADLSGYEGYEELTGIELSASGYLGRWVRGELPSMTFQVTFPPSVNGASGPDYASDKTKSGCYSVHSKGLYAKSQLEIELQQSLNA